MKLRLWKVGLLAGPALALSGLFILAGLAYSMNFLFADIVTFHGPTRQISAADREAIRRIVLADSWFGNPRTPALRRYNVQLTKLVNRDATIIVNGKILPNNDADPVGFLAVRKQDDEWKIVSFVTAGG